MLLQAGAGASAYYRDEDFGAAELAADAGPVLAKADVVLQVQPLGLEDIAMLKPGAVLVGLQQPWSSAERVKLLIEKQITCFALELLPRISRAQSMDVLSSQAAVAGYECALIAADHSPKFFPMLTYAAGTIRPAKVLVIGAGVAGLQAIATARRLGAMVEAYDVRAAAREQLETWGQRNNVTVIAQDKGDPAAVVFDAISAAKARGIDIVLADTAGRLPTQLHLMEEIRKVKRVISKALPQAPHEILLVLDANTGQNALAQVKAFDDALGLTGLILTKLDGTAKGGVIAAIARERPVPMYFVGVGETLDDLRPFSAREYVDALFD